MMRMLWFCLTLSFGVSLSVSSEFFGLVTNRRRAWVADMNTI